jgi:rfaE bifunctional protein nucleotidyltransferase chain/domain
MLTEEGRRQLRVVLIGGVFDIIHPGHIHTLSQAKSLGDVLVVSLARDTTVLKMRGKAPLFDEDQRAELLRNLKLVDHVHLGSEKNIYETVNHVKPDIIALGYDQKHREKEVAAESKKIGVDVTVVRLTSTMPDIKSSRIKADDGFAVKG